MTKHKSDCVMVFGRKDATCPRCQELLNGAPAREGWQKRYFEDKKRHEATRSDEIKAHFAIGGPHDIGKCGPVCTAFDW